MSCVIFGAGTDYAVFLISRYHDTSAWRVSSDEAVKRALASIGKVIAASAATVAVTFFAMIFTRLPVFSTVGPALAIAIFVAFVQRSPFLPAILVSPSGDERIKPRTANSPLVMAALGHTHRARPRSILVASLVGSAILASWRGLRALQLRRSQALRIRSRARWYNTSDRHFPLD